MNTEASDDSSLDQISSLIVSGSEYCVKNGTEVKIVVVVASELSDAFELTVSLTLVNTGSAVKTGVVCASGISTPLISRARNLFLSATLSAVLALRLSGMIGFVYPLFLYA